ncbi:MULTISPECIES: YheV family putative zinc ribbon protein [Dickeya]|uniref:YheV family putative zinc ribbon protein n=1 Tax=Dickeya oryzae TaxID=1240404 RepID=A0AB39I903_9GAMM|nr:MULTISPECIES: YheV family putative zinc ribbon protein [Dickeya]MBP2850821.1 YheV family putative metal-binding protein [Dickeya oryzae]MCA6995754.1 YheV family putative metal-binding protein [Dickeya oryzae]UPT54499.1 YheV family putative metal-binding protein [Dickeya zeae]
MRKRFIAGAVCPKCHSQDTLAVGREGDDDVVVCVHCGYQQSQSEAPPKAATPPTGEIIGLFRPE